jgi:hypothetical protein
MDSWNVLTDIEDDAEESSERRGEKRDWDTMLPYVLFAYWEVPQATLGFSPFELLYGRDIRIPVDILQEEWIYNQEVETDVLSYILDVRDRMDKAKELVLGMLKGSRRSTMIRRHGRWTSSQDIRFYYYY